MKRFGVLVNLAAATVLFAIPAVGLAQTASPSVPERSIAGTRLLFGPNGRLLPPGHGYVSFDGLILSSVNIGVTRWLSFGAGTTLLWDASSPRPYWVVPKVRLWAHDRTSIAFCLVRAQLPDRHSMGLAYVVGTRGDAARSFTIGVAVAYVVDRDGDEFDDAGASPALVIGGERRLTEHWTLISENYVTWAATVSSLGFRLRRGSLSLDLVGGLAVLYGEGAVGGPGISLAWHF